ncbi:DNA-directed RNA polymerase subunit beta', partial [Patescibacteria group bacterium]|nr:DNA-directed RNA polymerase subunit beta' [Patescibacteria group bacterium]
MAEIKKSPKKDLTPHNFDRVQISIASPDDIMSWSYGEILKPETINYRTQKPEKDGLFAENIFGPSKDWECYCGKYKKIRYKGIICDKCGVEVTRSIVRRQRMGHISLAVPIAHIWYLRGSPSQIGLILGLTSRNLEKVVYFAAYVVIEVNEEIRQDILDRLTNEFNQYKKQIKKDLKKNLDTLSQNMTQALSDAPAGQKKDIDKHYQKEIAKTKQQGALKYENLKNTFNKAMEEVGKLASNQIISEKKYRTLSLRYGQIIKAGIGAEAIYELLSKIDLEKQIKAIDIELKTAATQKRRKLLKKLRLVRNLFKANIRPESMIVKELPVIPPDLRPMVQLDGGRYASSDLNDLYRRVINRNNRLKKLIDLGAPEIICRNEKRMLQEAVDALIDNTPRRGKSAVLTSNRRKYKSLSDMLKGKQGRFRQNLLGKRVDYSGRSVIVVGPNLKLNHCGLPKKIALELYKPYIIHGLIEKGYAHNIKNAGKIIERKDPEVWDILEEVVTNSYVLLNRAPTLHRLGIQAFTPVLIEGKAIQIPPLVCVAYNADFDGDQMAVHLPLSKAAQSESRTYMSADKNLLKPADGEPIVAPAQDMILGCYYLTVEIPDRPGKGKYFTSLDEAIMAYNQDILDLHAKIKIMINEEIIETTLGRAIFNTIIPPELGYQNKVFVKGDLEEIIKKSWDICGLEPTSRFVDDIMKIGFEYATKSGITFSVEDINIPEEKQKIVDKTEEIVNQSLDQYYQGLITKKEHKQKLIDSWLESISKLNDIIKDHMNTENPLHSCVLSKARGNISQFGQMAGMKGLVSSPSGEIIELPIKSNFTEGLSELEYFISTHGSRKGKTDTALKTADAGYLTRRLVDVAQDIITTTEDCGTTEGVIFYREEIEKDFDDFTKRIIGRYPLNNITDPKTKKVIVKKDEIITSRTAKILSDHQSIEQIAVRSTLYCKNYWGVCTKCYGADLATSKRIKLGEAVGIVAAQSIGEPGTQLSMRTFHTGGVAVVADITQGLPRVEELFEARTPHSAAILADLPGKATIKEKDQELIVTITSSQVPTEEYEVTDDSVIRVKNQEKISDNQILAILPDQSEVRAKYRGTVTIRKNRITVKHPGKITKDFPIPSHLPLLINDGDLIARGDALTEGHINLSELLRYKGDLAVKKYLISEIQKTYMYVGSSIHDKHLEVIIRQMFSKVRITDQHDSSYLPREIVDLYRLEKDNNELKAKGKQPAKYENIIMGITKVSLKTESFLSAASFQETTGVLLNAAICGKTDYLRGLKE